MKRMVSALILFCLLFTAVNFLPEGEGSGVPTREPGRILYVAPENSTYTEIQHALDNTTEGDTIYVGPGVYDQGMMITTSGVTVIGNNSEGDVVVGKDYTAICGISADNVNVSGIRFTDTRTHLSIVSIISSENIMLDDVEIVCGKNGEGLYISGANNVIVGNLLVRSNNYAAARIKDSAGVLIENFDLSCNRSLQGCVELQGVDMVTLRSGRIELRSGGTAIYDVSGGSVFLYDIESAHTEKFLMMDTGNVSMYNMDISPPDIYMDFPNPLYTVRSYSIRDIIAEGETARGDLEALEGADINITTDGISIYSTPYYGGTDAVSGPDGRFGEDIAFLSWELLGGASGYRNGTSRIQAYFMGDREAQLEIDPVDANITDEIILEFADIFDQVRSVSGWITYLDGPMQGMNATNATVFVYGQNMTEVANVTVNETGIYVIEDLSVDANYTMVVVPEAEVEDQGDASGYLRITHNVTLTDDIVWDPELPYYEYIAPPPTSGPIHGYVHYSGGPKNGEFCEGAEVRLYDAEGDVIGTDATNENGYFIFDDIPFGDDYELRATPPLDELGENLKITGYLIWDGSAFPHNGSTMVNASLNYYEHVEPPVYHPKVTILDGNGDPVEGVQVEVTILGATYTAVTNAQGVATFEGLDMADFPANATFKASKEGYDDITWGQGETVPVMKESREEAYTWLILLLVGIVIIVLAVSAYLLFIRKVPEDEIEE
ncbi:MAG: hypothetical protein ACMUHU_07760 [Thermoplasmatota archaeon]